MPACDWRQAGISQQTQSLLAIVVPPLLMKPSLTNADECLSANTEGSDRGLGWGSERWAFIYPRPPPPPQRSRCFEEDEHSCINPVCSVLSLARLRRWGYARDGVNFSKKAVVVLLYRAVKLLEWRWWVPQSPCHWCQRSSYKAIKKMWSW